jgi:DNA-binding NarL/FixJ family response regulator
MLPGLNKRIEAEMVSVLIADDQALIRDAWSFLFQKAGNIEVVAMVANGKEAIEQAVLYCPSVAVMDISMPIMDGIEATKQICLSCPKTRVLIVSMYDAPRYIGGCLLAGALGYVLKDLAGDDLILAVHSVHAGNRYFSKRIAELAKSYIQ